MRRLYSLVRLYLFLCKAGLSHAFRSVLHRYKLNLNISLFTCDLTKRLNMLKVYITQIPTRRHVVLHDTLLINFVLFPFVGAGHEKKCDGPSWRGLGYPGAIF